MADDALQSQLRADGSAVAGPPDGVAPAANPLGPDEAKAAATTGCTAWKETLLRQVVARDQATQGLHELMDLYSHGQRSLHGFGADPREMHGHLERRHQAAHAPPPQLDAGVSSVQPVDLSNWTAERLFEVCKRLRSDLASRNKELEAIQKLLHEREEELRDKEHAHIEVCRQATQLGRENVALRAELKTLTKLRPAAAGDGVSSAP
mmetsp:Transcript_32207/g.75627  ORF Transcript_32207/g.75627 Transcript_32207/m.75627 type:complete len:207 (+) Transcript_32207:41-661(+)